MRPRLSPDDRHLAYAERRANRTFLMLKELATGETSQLGELDPDSLQASPWHDAVPRFDFLPDGSALIANAEGRLRRFPVSGDDPVDIPFRANVDQPLGPLVRDPIPLDTGPVRAPSPSLFSSSWNGVWSWCGYSYFTVTYITTPSSHGYFFNG